MMNRIYSFFAARSDCAKRSFKTFFQAFAAVLITSLSSAQPDSPDAQSAIVKSALTAAIAAGIAALMNMKRGEK